jgi:nucleotide-binding universal stress UspA family protein
MSEPIRNLVAGVAAPLAADPALRAAVELARGCGADLHLVHAFEPPLLSALKPNPHSAYLHHRDGREQRLRAALYDAVKEVAGPTPGFRIRAWVYPTSPGEAMLAVARRVDADLVVVGSSRHGALEQVLLGTAAQRVVRGSPAPVLVARGSFADAPRRVLLTTDLSEMSGEVHDTALETVAALFPGAEPEVRSLAVVWHGILPPPLPPDLLLHETLGELRIFLSARPARLTAVEPAARLGRPADEIAREAAEWNADLLVLGTHARHGVERFFAGSVAEGALAQAACSVLVIPPVRVYAEQGDHEPLGALAHA